ncbi:MAG: hypothetical protein NZM44_04200 [Candidatus Calescibacterium sp.]|nr:hypothetical protein [Candidatus Calescibacterium sp.]
MEKENISFMLKQKIIDGQFQDFITYMPPNIELTIIQHLDLCWEMVLEWGSISNVKAFMNKFDIINKTSKNGKPLIFMIFDLAKQKPEKITLVSLVAQNRRSLDVLDNKRNNAVMYLIETDNNTAFGLYFRNISQYFNDTHTNINQENVYHFLAGAGEQINTAYWGYLVNFTEEAIFNKNKNNETPIQIMYKKNNAIFFDRLLFFYYRSYKEDPAKVKKFFLNVFNSNARNEIKKIFEKYWMFIS